MGIESGVRHKGKVIWFNIQRGYGFIRPESSSVNEGHDLFVHFQFIIQRGLKSLNPDDIVEFSVGKNQKGLCAQDVKILEAKNE